jgi:hypothetical protein
MTCPTDGDLRARLDAQLEPAESLEVENHLAACAACRARAERISRGAESVNKALAALAPVPGEAPADAVAALALFKAGERSRDAASGPALSRLFPSRLRPAWAALAALVLLGGFLSFAPGRSWAQKVLAMLRVQKIAVVPVDFSALGGPNGDGAPAKMFSQMLSEKVVVTLSSKPQKVGSVDEASERAGYRVRLLGSRSDMPQLTVEGEQAFQTTLDRDRLQTILDEAGHSELSLPGSVNGATVAVHVPALVAARYGTCPERKSGGQDQQGADFRDCAELIQVPSPTVSVPPDLNVEQLAEIGLQLAGMTADQAHAFCQTVDWTSTLVLPLPRFIHSYQTVQVNGVQGTLIQLPARGRQRLLGYNLVWVKDGVIYSLMGFGNPVEAAPLAESLD